MTACRDQVLDALEALLAGIVDPAGLTVDRDRTEPVTDEELPIFVLYDFGDAPNADRQDGTGERGVTLSASLEGAASGATGEAAEIALGVLRANVQQRLWADPTLGGLVRMMSETPEPPPRQLALAAAIPTARFVIGVALVFAVDPANPDVFA